MPPRFLYFDAAFTLIQPFPSVGTVYAREASRFATMVDAARLDAAFFPAYRRLATDGGGLAAMIGTEADARAFWRAIVEEVFRAADSTMPGDPYFDDVFDLFATSECWRVYSDVESALELARAAGVRLGVLSNFDQRLHGIVEALGLAGSFEVVLASADAGFAKPAPAVFEKAREAAGIESPTDLALIGDSIAEDVEGALAAGWRV